MIGRQNTMLSYYWKIIKTSSCQADMSHNFPIVMIKTSELTCHGQLSYIFHLAKYVTKNCVTATTRPVTEVFSFYFPY